MARRLHPDTPLGEHLLVKAVIDMLLAKKLALAELKVLEKVCSGMSNKQAAEALFVCEKTVKTHVTHINRKLGTRSRCEVMALVMMSYLEQPVRTRRIEIPVEFFGDPTL